MEKTSKAPRARLRASLGGAIAALALVAADRRPPRLPRRAAASLSRCWLASRPAAPPIPSRASSEPSLVKSSDATSSSRTVPARAPTSPRAPSCQAPPDGNTLLVTTAALPINETLYKNKGFVASTLMPISIVATTPEVFAINKNDKAQNLAEFIAQSKDKEVIFATAGIGTGSHIAGEYFFRFIVKTNAKHIPFRGGPDATNAVLGGHVPMVVSSLSGFPSQVASGELRGLAIAAEQRNAVIPQVPTFAEAGYPGFTSFSWVGFFAPAGTNAQIVQDLNKQIDAITRDPAVDKRLRSIGFDPMAGDVKARKPSWRANMRNGRRWSNRSTSRSSDHSTRAGASMTKTFPGGARLPLTLDDFVHPAHTALLMWDFQKGLAGKALRCAARHRQCAAPARRRRPQQRARSSGAATSCRRSIS